MRGPPSLWGQFSPPDLFRSISHSDLRAEARLGRGRFSNRRPKRGPDGFETNRPPHPLPSATIRHPLSAGSLQYELGNFMIIATNVRVRRSAGWLAGRYYR